MKNSSNFRVILILVIGSIFLIESCKKESTAPTVTTLIVSDITQATASSGGNVTGDGGAEVTSRGVCWNTSENPTTGNSKTSDGKGTGSFTSSLVQLSPGTKYYVRAYAINEVGTAYGSQLSFTTGDILLATLTTSDVSSITQTSAVSGGTIASAGGGTVTARGVCWSTNQDPTTTDSKNSEGSGTGSFSSSLSQLMPGTQYYVRAYATNEAGTAYGNQQTFTTEQVMLATLTTAEITAITGTSAITGGTVTDDGGDLTTIRGVCWATTPNPETSDNVEYSGSGTGSYVINITGLSGATTYYVRACATNSAGTAYGNELSFPTLADLPSLATAMVTNVSETSATSGGNFGNDGGAAITEKGVCWSTSHNPTIADNHTNDGSGLDDFVSNLTGLDPSTTYYVRAYATNSAGTGYGSVEYPLTTLGGQSGTVSDVEGNVYKTITIGNLTWMAENLRTTKFNNGDDIALVTDNDEWKNLVSDAYCYYNNDALTNGTEYGVLYNWYAVSDQRKICPTGWHLPDFYEMYDLGYLIGSVNSGGKLKEAGTVHWLAPNEGATNEYGFTALPGGYRDSYSGIFYKVGEEGWHWTGDGNTYYKDAWNYRFTYSDESYRYNNIVWRTGSSVRCVKD